MASQHERDQARLKNYLSNPKPFFVNKDTARAKPLFGRTNSGANSTDKGLFGVEPVEAEIVAVQDATSPSRIPRRASYSPDTNTNSSKTGGLSLTGAYKRVIQEEERKSSVSPEVAANSWSRGGAGRVSLARAYNKAAQEEVQDGFGKLEKAGSPSPAPRPRIGTRESDERRKAAILRAYNGRPATAPVSEHRQESADEDLTTGSGGSVLESVESLGDFNDSTIEKKMTQYQRDLARKQNILKNHLLFAGSEHEGGKSLNRKSSTSSLESEPVVVRNVSSWGSKARLGSTWMRKIISPDDSGELAQLPKASIQDSSVDWAGVAADIPIASVEDDDSTQQPTPPHSRPSSAQLSMSSPQKSQVWDAELDFTAKSLAGYGTSPQLNIRGPKIDEVTAREIETLSRRAVATSRLEEIRERNSASPELTRSPTSSLKRKDSETSLQRDTIERYATPDATNIPSTEVQPVEQPRLSSEDRYRRSLSRDDITAALNPAKTPRRKTPSPTEYSQRPKMVEGELAERSVPELAKTSTIEVQPEEQSRPSSKNSQSTAPKQPTLTTMPPSLPNATRRTPVKDEYFHEKTILEEEGEHISGTPITIFYGAAKNEKPDHKRTNSWETLQKLATLLNSSPTVPSGEQPSKGPVRAEPSKLRDAIPLDVKRLSAPSTPPKSDVDPEERIAAEASLFDLPENNKSERNSLRAPSPDDYSDAVDETPRPKRDPLSIPTPVVTGAYVETPATARLASDMALKDFVRGESSQHRSSSSRASRDRVSDVLSSHAVNVDPRGKSAPPFRPHLINTANPSSVADDLRRIQQEAQIEDSTLDDFDDLLAASDDSDANSTIALETTIDLENDERGRPLSDQERERRREALAYERINKGLKTGLLSIRDAKRGIERLEGQVSSSPEPAIYISEKTKLGLKVAAANGQNTLFIAVPVPRLWSWDDTKRWGFHLTWLGLILALCMSWLLAETLTCEIICKPEYASTNNWRPDDPLWGMALPTLVDRASGGLLSIIGTVFGGLVRWIGKMLAESGAGVVKKPTTWMEGRMDDDERL